MSDRLPISVFIIARNEADRIDRPIRAVRDLAGEVLVVDSGSTDRTREIAADLGARVLENAWPGYGPQKRFAEEHCANNWLLNLDADEEPSPELCREIRALFAAGGPGCDAYEVPIADVFPHEDRPSPHAYTLSPVRLYRKDKGRYAASLVHDRVELVPGARTGRLSGLVHHRSIRSLGDEIRKFNEYTDLQADDLDARGRRLSAARLVFEFPSSFLKGYVGRGHWRRGTYGFLLAMNYAICRHLRLAKHVERRLARETAAPGKPQTTPLRDEARGPK
jgi:glycosyltransferase involved in cell wall biosynthesis